MVQLGAQIGQIWALMRHLGVQMAYLNQIGAQMGQPGTQMEIQIGSNGPQFVSFELKVGPFELKLAHLSPNLAHLSPKLAHLCPKLAHVCPKLAHSLS